MENELMYELRIEYGEEPENPSNIFYTMGNLIDSMGQLDLVLIEALPYTLKSSVVLQSVQQGSLISKLKSIVMSIDDEALEELDIAKIIGSYLRQGKYKFIRFLENKERINSSEETKCLKHSLENITVHNTDSNKIQPEISEKRLLNALNTISESLKQLNEGQEAIYISSEGSIIINKKFNLTTDQIEDLLTEETKKSTTKEILVIKKPDYIGRSMWQFYKSNTDGLINVRIKDESWLEEFQAGNIDLRPGDNMKVLLECNISLDRKSKETHSSYSILKVDEIIRNSRGDTDQLTLY